MGGLILCFALAANARPAADDSTVARARHYLLNYHRDAGFLDSAAALADAGTGPAWLALRAQLEIIRGERATTREEKQRRYRAALGAAERLRETRPDDPVGHVWWAAAKGRLLQLAGGAAMALGAGAVKRANERALELDPRCALASYALGRMCEEAPGILGGGAKRALAHYRRGVGADPDYTIIRLALARLLAGQGRAAEARAELQRLLETERPTNPAECELFDRPAALRLRSQLGGE